MSEEHDSWFKSAFGVDLGEVADKAKAVVEQVENKVVAVVKQAEGIVEGAVAEVAGAAEGLVKKAAAAVSPSSGSSAGGKGSFPLGGSVGRGGKNAPGDVRAVQAALGIAADGKCGGGTIGAIEAFQRSIGQSKPDGRVDAGGGTERALAGGGSGATAAAPKPAQAGDDSESSLLDKAVEGVKELGGKIVKEAGEEFDAAKGLGDKVVEGAKKTIGADQNDGSDGKPAVPQADGGFSKALTDAVAGLVPVINIPGLGSFDMAANLTKAANEVVANNTPRKLPFLEEATELLAQASSILDENLTSKIGAIPLPQPTVAFSGTCCSIDELQKFRGAIEPPRNGLLSAVNAYNDTQRAIEDAAEQGKRICYGALAACLFGTASPLGRGAGGVAICLAASVTCIGGASPVQNAIRTQIKAKADVEIANGALGRALANHRNCFVNLCPTPAGPSIKKPPEAVDLGDVGDPPAVDIGDID